MDKKLERKGYISVKYQYNGSVVKNRYIVIDHAVNKNVNGTVNKMLMAPLTKMLKIILLEILILQEINRDEKLKLLTYIKNTLEY